ncbi:1-(5-phosphoribosyl)-5-[(5-phosphoribosylamino)methylideneamino]imidazole-4-carboxamide isomerase [Chloroflexota bacterium]
MPILTYKHSNSEGLDTIDIIPAIDIRDGKCVRLYQGDYNQEIIYSDDPVEVALSWQSVGAPRLHVVDLDGAASGELRNLDIITEIAHALLIPTQLGGGIRHLETIEELLKAGIERVILSTAAVETPELIEKACRKFSESIIVSIDAKLGYVATHAWQQETQLQTIEFAQAMTRLGVRRFIYTDIARDGTLTEPNFTAIAELVDAIRTPLIVAGGISSPVHLNILKQLRVEGAIIGKALYTGDINLKEVLSKIG